MFHFSSWWGNLRHHFDILFLDLQSPVNDIKKLFKKGKATKLVKPVSNEEPIDFIVITDSSDEGSDKADGRKYSVILSNSLFYSKLVL